MINTPGRLFEGQSLQVDWGDMKLDGVKKTGDPVTPGSWIHIPMVFAEGNLTHLYVDGIQYPFDKPWPNWLKIRVYRWRKWLRKVREGEKD